MRKLLWLFMLVPLVPLAGVVYQRIGARKDRRTLLTQGRVIDIGDGRQVYLLEKGSGGPAVVFESGIAATSQNWSAVQAAISRGSRTISYDRAGLGWSSASATPRTPSNIAKELHLLLQRAEVPAPYLLVGHSFGGLVVRLYAADYSSQVAGVVLIDSMRPEEWSPLNEKRDAMVQRGLHLATVGCRFAEFGLVRIAIRSLLGRSLRMSQVFSRVVGTGGRHVLDRIVCEVSKMPSAAWPIIAAHWSTPSFYRGLAAQLRAVPASVTEMAEVSPIQGVPVCLLTAATALPLSVVELQSIGNGAEQVIAKKSAHWIHLDEPELVIDTIMRMLKQVRSQ